MGAFDVKTVKVRNGRTLKWTYWSVSRDLQDTFAIHPTKEIEMSADQSDKSVLPLQGFVESELSDQIMGICSEIENIEGYASDLGRLFVPHVTLGSWKLTPQELQEAESVFMCRLTGLSCIEVEASLKEDEKDGRLSCFLVPQITQPLLQFHSQVHERLSWDYEPFRQIDLPGSWWPHLTLFSIPSAQKDRIVPSLRRLSDIRTLRIERIGLIGFRPTRVISEVRLDKAEP